MTFRVGLTEPRTTPLTPTRREADADAVDDQRGGNDQASNFSTHLAAPTAILPSQQLARAATPDARPLDRRRWDMHGLRYRAPAN